MPFDIHRIGWNLSSWIERICYRLRPRAYLMFSSQAPHRNHWITAHFCLVGIFVSSIAVDLMLRWTDRFEGLVSGFLQGIFLAIPAGILLLPWSLLIVWLYRWTRWSRGRMFLIILPGLLAYGSVLVGWILQPPGPQTTFANWSKMKLPEDAMNLRYYYSGGGFADHTIIFHFQSSPAQLEKLVSGMNLRDEGCLEPFEYEITFKRRPMAPDFEKWKDATRFTRFDGTRNYEMLVNASKTEAYIYFMSI